MERITNILYIMDSEMCGMQALEHVMLLARDHRANVTLLDVIEKLPSSTRMMVTAIPPGDLKDSVIRKRSRQLEELASILECGPGVLQTQVHFGNPAKEAVREAAEGGYDLVIKRPGKHRTDNYLLRNCRCPVLLLKPEDCQTFDEALATMNYQYAQARKKVTGRLDISNVIQSIAG